MSKIEQASIARALLEQAQSAIYTLIPNDLPSDLQDSIDGDLGDGFILVEHTLDRIRLILVDIEESE